MTELQNFTLLKNGADCFNAARKNLYAGAAILYEIEQTKAWEGSYSSFTEYVEQQCQLSKGFASKLLQSWKFYVVDRGVSHAKLEGVDAEKLYLSTKLPQETLTGIRSPDDMLLIAREWSREDLRAELSTHDGKECDHPEDKRVILCGCCGKRVS